MIPALLKFMLPWRELPIVDRNGQRDGTTKLVGEGVPRIGQTGRLVDRKSGSDNCNYIAARPQQVGRGYIPKIRRVQPDEIVYLRADKPASDGVRRANDDDL